MTSSAIEIKTNNVVYSRDMYAVNQSVHHTRPLYKCRVCGAKMSLKLPYEKSNHFSHYPGDEKAVDCVLRGYDSGQSEEHFRAKDFFYGIYNNHRDYKYADMEHILYASDGSVLRIGDVVMYPKDHNVRPTVIEIQRSAMKLGDIIRRTKDWNVNGYDVMWVITLNSKSLVRKYISHICLRALHQYVYFTHFDPKHEYEGSLRVISDDGYTDVECFDIIHVHIVYEGNEYMLSMVNDISVCRQLDRVESERDYKQEERDRRQKELDRKKAEQEKIFIDYDRMLSARRKRYLELESNRRMLKFHLSDSFNKKKLKEDKIERAKLKRRLVELKHDLDIRKLKGDCNEE